MKAVIAQSAEDSVDLLARIRRQFNDSAQLKLKAHDALAGRSPAPRRSCEMPARQRQDPRVRERWFGRRCQHFSAELLNRFERERLGSLLLR